MRAGERAHAMGFDACRGAGGVLALELAWSLGLGLEDRNRMGETCLLVAAGACEGELMARLVRQGADVEAEDINGNRALHLTASRGFAEGIEILLSGGANIEARITGSALGATPLMRSANKGGHPAFWLLLKHGASPNVFDQNGSSPLREVILSRDEEAAHALVELGADLSVPSVSGFVWDDARRMGLIELGNFLEQRSAAISEAQEIGAGIQAGKLGAGRFSL